MTPIELSPEQARVLAALVEKSITTPAYYPMTVNALGNACNQKSCRNPVMSLSEGEVGAALTDLEALQLVARDDSSPRSVKWRHRFQHQMLLRGAPLAVLVTLMLRGPQTASELRSNASTLGGPDSAEDLAAVLEDLEDRAQPLIRLLPRAAGQKEARYVHLLCGEPDLTAFTAPPARPAGGAGRDALQQRIEALEARMAALESALGVTPPEA